MPTIVPEDTQVLLAVLADVGWLQPTLQGVCPHENRQDAQASCRIQVLLPDVPGSGSTRAVPCHGLPFHIRRRALLGQRDRVIQRGKVHSRMENQQQEYNTFYAGFCAGEVITSGRQVLDLLPDDEELLEDVLVRQFENFREEL